MVKTARNPQAAKKLIAFLASDQTTTAIRSSGMRPLGEQRKQ
jgi:ABC-type Fe3+ transport system substrate-binding protein